MKELEEAVVKLKKMKNVKTAILFGSYAKGKNRENSDIDICVITSNKNEKPLEVSSEKLDISLYYKLPTQIRYKVFRDGKILFNRDKKLLVRLKSQTIRNYLDEKWWIDRFTKRVLS